MVIYVIMVTSHMTLFMNKWTNTVMDDGWIGSSLGRNPTFSCWLVFYPKGTWLRWKGCFVAEEKVDRVEKFERRRGHQGSFSPLQRLTNCAIWCRVEACWKNCSHLAALFLLCSIRTWGISYGPLLLCNQMCVCVCVYTCDGVLGDLVSCEDCISLANCIV